MQAADLVAYRQSVDALGAASASFVAQVGALVAHQLVAAHIVEAPGARILSGVTADYRGLLLLTAERLVIEVVATCAKMGARLDPARVQAIFALAAAPIALPERDVPTAPSSTREQ
jgi:hypothetical protein